MDTEHPVDLRAVFGVIDSAEIVIFRFVTIPQRLLFDARYNEMEGPLLTLVSPVRSLDERMKALKRLRPRFGLPEKLTAVRWPRYVRSLRDSGAWDRILRRMGSCGYPQIADRACHVYRELELRERAELYNAITGVGYRSLWDRVC